DLLFRRGVEALVGAVLGRARRHPGRVGQPLLRGFLLRCLLLHRSILASRVVPRPVRSGCTGKATSEAQEPRLPGDLLTTELPVVTSQPLGYLPLGEVPEVEPVDLQLVFQRFAAQLVQRRTLTFP